MPTIAHRSFFRNGDTTWVATGAMLTADLLERELGWLLSKQQQLQRKHDAQVAKLVHAFNFLIIR